MGRLKEVGQVPPRLESCLKFRGKVALNGLLPSLCIQALSGYQAELSPFRLSSWISRLSIIYDSVEAEEDENEPCVP